MEGRVVHRAKIACETSDYGCYNGYCWANCGPRVASGDWCYTTKGNVMLISESSIIKVNSTTPKNNNMTINAVNLNDIEKIENKDEEKKVFVLYASCQTKNECNPSLECAEGCSAYL